MKTSTIIAIIAIVIIGGILIFTQKKNVVNAPEMMNQEKGTVASNSGMTNTGAPVTEPEMTVRTKVIEFGRKMKLVSTVEGDFKSQVQGQYGMYVTPKLIDAWQANPDQAIAAHSSNPWPDRIEITSVTKVDADTYTVYGNVIEVGADSPKTVGSYPVTVTVKNDRGAWLITAISKGAYVKAS